MTAPAARPGIDAEPDDELELSRITVLVGGVLVDVGVPSRVRISAVVNDVIDLANQQLAAREDEPEFENAEGRMTFARLTGAALDPGRSLAELGVYDGELLVIHEIGANESSVLIDELKGTASAADRHLQCFTGNGWTAGWFALGIALSVAAAVLLPRVAVASVAGISSAAIAALLVALGCVAAACIIPYRSGNSGVAALLAGISLPLSFGGVLDILPGGHELQALPMAFAVVALVALVQLLITGRGRTLYSGVIAVALLGGSGALAHGVFGVSGRSVAVVLTTASVIVVYLAPRVTILLSSVPVPRVPTAGEPLGDIETQGGTAVEGVSAIGKQVIPNEEAMTDRVWQATEYLTGIMAAAGLTAAAGCYLVADVDNGFYWQGTAFAFAVATVLCLRGRSHHGLVQSAALIGCGLAVPLSVIAKTATFVTSWQVNAAVTLIALTVVVVLCGIVAPALDFSPTIRRRVEIAEYIAVGLVFPLACWILGVYAYFRGLRI
ncbi:type VII secretion integral membrane protein EccD [Mycobacterium sp. ACS1612]|uniref:type VII secretion integral membrane protein EccD n=1 Tax=Mycobacterium sp. ACS1612 TaxID=1834117 RepID=UPI000800FE88|nr:type VII secretion integral membrane protein EccD [Mycobacterium sp. ACS1612]OBF33792.1 type VII secretion integral membrane protein EccD [Mycobacterium sp. ACS1612]